MKIKEEILLTIAIPAYNQAEALKSTLESVAELYSNSTSFNIEVIVADNCSIDSTNSVANAFIERLPNYRYQKHSENLGFIGNFAYLLTEANGKYIWFLGCGETIFPSSAEHLFNELLSSELEIITLGNSDQLRNESEGVQKATDFELLSQDTWGTIPLYDASFACLIFNRQTINRYLPEVLKKGGAWPHVELALKLEISKSGHPQILGRYNIPTVNIYRDDEGWWNKQIVFRNLIEIIELLDKYATLASDTGLKKAIENNSPKCNLKNLGLWILSAKKSSVKPNKFEFRFFWSLIHFRNRESIFLALALLSPIWMVKMFIFLSSFVTKPESID